MNETQASISSLSGSATAVRWTHSLATTLPQYLPVLVNGAAYLIWVAPNSTQTSENTSIILVARMNMPLLRVPCLCSLSKGNQRENHNVRGPLKKDAPIFPKAQGGNVLVCNQPSRVKQTNERHNPVEDLERTSRIPFGPRFDDAGQTAPRPSPLFIGFRIPALYGHPPTKNTYFDCNIVSREIPRWRFSPHLTEMEKRSRVSS